MGSGSAGSSTGRFSPKGLDSPPIPVPTNTTVTKSSERSATTQDSSNPSGATMDSEIVVLVDPENANFRDSSSPSEDLPDPQEVQECHSTDGPSVRLPFGWKPHRTTGLDFSEDAKRLIDMDIRNSSRRQYNCKFTVFAQYCHDRDIDPYTCSIQPVANFLAFVATHRVYRGKKADSYSNVAGYRTAISHFHQGWGGISVGDHPLISSLVKGVFNTKPPLKKYTHVWSKDKLLEAWKVKDIPLQEWSVKDLRAGLLVRLVMAGCLR